MSDLNALAERLVRVVNHCFSRQDIKDVMDAADTLRSLAGQEPVAWYSPDWKIFVRHGEHKPWPDANIPLYASPVPAVDLEAWKAEAMRLADQFAIAHALNIRYGSERVEEAKAARTALQAHLDKLGGKND